MTPSQIHQYEELAGSLGRATAAHIADMCQALNRTGELRNDPAAAALQFDRGCGTARAMLDAQRAMILDLETQAARQGFRS